MTTAEELHALRKAMGLSQRELAKLLAVPGKHGDRTVRRWESGERKVPELVLREARRQAGL